MKTTTASAFNKSQIMSRAWMFRKYGSKLNASDAMKKAWAEAKKMAVVFASTTMPATNPERTPVQRWSTRFEMLNGSRVQKGDLRHDALLAAAEIRDTTTGFAAQVATSVCASRRCSSKQAWVLANTAVAQNIAL